jgi:Domain of unknown function (DUF1905)
MCYIPVPFDPKPVFGKVRAPVTVTVNGYTYRSTIAAMGGPPCVPLRKSNREAAGLNGDESLEVTLALDTVKREIRPPADLVKALKAKTAVWQHWQTLSYSPARVCRSDRGGEEARNAPQKDRERCSSDRGQGGALTRRGAR